MTLSLARRALCTSLASVVAACGMLGGGGAETGIAECDAFLVQYRCYLKKNGMSDADVDKTVGPMAKAWKDAGSNPAARGAIVSACNQQLSAQASNFGRAGCGSGGGATPAQPPDSPVQGPGQRPAGPTPAQPRPPLPKPTATAAAAACPAGQKAVRDGTGGTTCMTPCDPKKVFCGNGPMRCSPFGPDQVPVCQ